MLGDERLQAAYQRDRASAGPHVTDAEWEQLACREVGDVDRQRLLTHILACTQCTEIHRSLLAVEKEAAAFDPQVAALQKTTATSRVWIYTIGLAAAAVFAFVMIDVRTPSIVDSGVTRSRPGLVTIAIATPSANGALIDRRIEWQRIDGADSYEILINTQDGEPLWSSIVTANVVTIPATVAMPAGSYYAQVKALRQSAAIGSSALVPFRVE